MLAKQKELELRIAKLEKKWETSVTHTAHW
jgi:hypothetical protein